MYMGRISVVVFWAFCCTLTLAACQKVEEPTYPITESYQYPVVPGMEEWAKLGSLQEMAEACQIPEEILSKMTTEALVVQRDLSNIEGIGYKPDLWVPPHRAIELVLKFIEKYY